jgi:hypothetical protein
MGFDAAAWWLSREPVAAISAQFIVPAEPLRKGATLYLYFGVEPAGGHRVLQPLIQYGANQLGGGDYWQLSTWDCCDLKNGGIIHYTSPVRVNPGDTVTASLTESCSVNDCSWAAMQAVNGVIGPSGTFDLGARIDFVYKYGGALESYGITDCTQSYPAGGAATFSDIAIRDRAGNTLSPTWLPWINQGTVVNGTPCSFNIVPGFNSVTVEF